MMNAQPAIMPDKTSQHRQWVQAVAAHRSAGDFRLLYDFYAPRLHSFFLKQGVPAAVAPDLVHDSMLNVWHKAGLYDPNVAAVSTWIFRIAKNRRIDWQRGQKLPTTVLDESLVDPSPTPETVVGDSHLRQRVEDFINSQPVEQQPLLRLALVQMQSHQQIAAATHLPLGTVKSRVRAALQKLRASIFPNPAYKL